MPTFLYEALPVPIVASTGSVSSLADILAQSFGSNLSSYRDFFVIYDGENSLPRGNDGTGWGYWNPSNHIDSSWYINGNDVGQGLPSHYVSLAQLGTASLHVGNIIGTYTHVAIRINAPNVAPADYEPVWYTLNIVNPGLISATAANGAPTPSDVVAAAQRIAAAYAGQPAPLDCGWICMAAAAAAGANLPVLSQNPDPTQNVDGGFWRVVYRGSDPNPVEHWQTLVQPGDIVRMAWRDSPALVGDGPGRHTTTVLSVNADGSINVLDNSGPGGTIAIHRANYDQFTSATSVTIYRLSPDHLYLIDRTNNSEIIAGSPYNDAVLSRDGNDSVASGIGNDVVLGNQGNDVILGQQGDDVLVGGIGNDIVVGGKDADLLFGNEANDILFGNEASDTIFSGQGDDLVFAGQGNDIVFGNQGNDTLSGNEGADRFIFAAGDGADLLRGFNASDGDRLVVGGLSFTVAQGANGNALISLSGGGTIELEGIGAASVTGQYFA